eukprot:GILK01006558.1.p1 GENE.GILK01006558.1~~GILK01006558.1.p1  ORF type:complete len:811 (+),score=140.48 GILK01006558.1:83-2515(+)
MISVFGYAVTHPIVIFAILRWITTQSWSARYFAPALYGGLLFLFGLYWFVRKTLSLKRIQHQIFFLSATHMSLLGVCTAAFHIATAYALIQLNMTLGRYIMMALPFDLAFQLVLQPLALKRPLLVSHFLALLVAAGGYVLYYWLTYADDGFAFSLTADESYVAYIVVGVSRFGYVCRGVFSTRIQVDRGYELRQRIYSYYWQTKFEHNSKIKSKKAAAAAAEAEAVQPQTDSTPSVGINGPIKQQHYAAATTLSIPDGGQFFSVSRRTSVSVHRAAVEHDKPLVRRQTNKILPDSEGNSTFVSVPMGPSDHELSQESKILNMQSHLFVGYNDLYLTRLDQIYDDPIYDLELKGVSVSNTFEVHAISSGLFLSPIAIICGFFHGAEIPKTFQLLIEDQWTSADIFGRSDGLCLIVLAVAAVLLLLQPLFIARTVLRHQVEWHFGVNVSANLLGVICSSIWIGNNQTLNSLTTLGIFLHGLSFAIYWFGQRKYRSHMQSQSDVQSVKTSLPVDLSNEEYSKLDHQIQLARRYLSHSDLSRTLVDLAVSRDVRTFNFSANPVLPTRRLHDPYYYHRVSAWGGGCARPLVEVYDAESDEEKETPAAVAALKHQESVRLNNLETAGSHLNSYQSEPAAHVLHIPAHLAIDQSTHQFHAEKTSLLGPTVIPLNPETDSSQLTVMTGDHFQQQPNSDMNHNETQFLNQHYSNHQAPSESIAPPASEQASQSQIDPQFSQFFSPSPNGSLSGGDSRPTRLPPLNFSPMTSQQLFAQTASKDDELLFAPPSRSASRKTKSFAVTDEEEGEIMDFTSRRR